MIPGIRGLRAEAAALAVADRWWIAAGASTAGIGGGAVLCQAATPSPVGGPAAHALAQLGIILAALATLLLGGWSVWLARLDLREHRLPNPVLVWATLSVIAVGVAALLALGAGSRLLAALGTTLIVLGAALTAWVARPAAFGAGDLKLVPVTVFPVAAIDPLLVATGYAGTLLLGVMLAGVVAHRRGRAEFAAGPILLLACWTGLALGAGALCRDIAG
ncbi:hypothetical protein FM113_03100 [Leucobacter sp. 7(1)]|uniref:hypothetical protein n=1 Tax=Leucobacter sp. 7(1) TaxID=1255613 RepID=UPI00097F0B00|nr:hypothetical protein [Leucobacter sp. 7(1)]SJN08528.1 hypothetical protein FM113_03100 [Leucobacter sp. 7(1)]